MVVAPFTSQGEERPVSSILDRKQPSASKGVGWLAPYRDTFLTELGQLGYAAKTIGDLPTTPASFSPISARTTVGGTTKTDSSKARTSAPHAV